ncbi:serine protease [Streptomyces sp. NPDC056632]|uniref:serine protease n=1 Tax=Streptomyces sp. NPDC056632 TaxID=3345884 RepID=UPI0036C059DC
MNDHPTKRRTVLRGFAVAAAGACLSTTATATATATTATAAARGAETYALRLVHLGRDGAPTAAHVTHLTGLSGALAGTTLTPEDPSGTVTVRVPRGRYLLDSAIDGKDWIVQPRLDVDGDTTVVLDARTTAPVDVRPPDANATFSHGGSFVEVTYQGATALANLVRSTPELRVAHLGPAAEPGSVRSWVDTYWEGARGRYVLGYTFSSDRAPTGLVRRPAPGDLATLVVRAAAPATGPGYGFVDLAPSPGPTPALALAVPVPGAVTFFVTPERGTWDVTYSAPSEPEKGAANRYLALGIALRAGTTAVHTFDGPVFGPALDPSPSAPPPGLRDGNSLDLALPLLADGDGHVPSSPLHLGATTTLHRDGVLVGTRRGTPGHASFTVPAGRASYRLSTTAIRPVGQVTATWTFVSAATRSPTELPLGIVRFAPELGPDGTVPPLRTTRVGVSVQGAAERSGVRSLAVSVSTDRGATWVPARVTDGAFALTAPGPGRTVSLRAELTDVFGNTLTQTHVDAFGTGAGTPGVR